MEHKNKEYLDLTEKQLQNKIKQVNFKAQQIMNTYF